MKKFLLMAALVAAAGILVKFRLFPALHSADVDSPNKGKGASADPPPSPPPQQPLPETDGAQLYEAHKYKEAASVLRAEIQEMERKKEFRAAASQRVMLADCYSQLNLEEKAVAELKKIYNDPNSDPADKANAANLLSRLDPDPEAREHFHRDALQGPEKSSGTAQALMSETLPLLDQEGKEYEARGTLSKILLDGSLPPEQAKGVKEKIMAANQRLVFSPMPTPDSLQYEVQHGDTLTRIAGEHKTTVGLIRRANGLESDHLRLGQGLKIIPCDGCELFISKTDLTVGLWLKGHFIKEYPCCIGDPKTPTPVGDFTIEKRSVDPMWNGIPAGNPKNILGTRWMGLNPPHTSIGVHGTTEPETVPGRHSAGCVRMLNKDVEEVYDFAIDKTQVHIKP